jgi:hypothetical protein
MPGNYITVSEVKLEYIDCPEDGGINHLQTDSNKLAFNMALFPKRLFSSAFHCQVHLTTLPVFMPQTIRTRCLVVGKLKDDELKGRVVGSTLEFTWRNL